MRTARARARPHASPPADDPEGPPDEIAAYGRAVEALLAGRGEDARPGVARTLLARDRVARSLANGRVAAPDELVRLTALDRRLQENAGRIEALAGAAAFRAWRASLQPPPGA